MFHTVLFPFTSGVWLTGTSPTGSGQGAAGVQLPLGPGFQWDKKQNERIKLLICGR